MRVFYLLDNTFVVSQEEFNSFTMQYKIVKEYEVHPNCKLLDSEISLKLEAYSNNQIDQPNWLTI